MNKIFIKMYVEAVHSGMLADMGPERWQTLCALASFMDRDGKCYPTQELLGHRLGISKENANRRVQKLLKYRWNGEPVLTMIKVRNPISGSWLKSVYTIHPNSGLSIFDADSKLSTTCSERQLNKNHSNENYIN